MADVQSAVLAVYDAVWDQRGAIQGALEASSERYQQIDAKLSQILDRLEQITDHRTLFDSYDEHSRQLRTQLKQHFVGREEAFESVEQFLANPAGGYWLCTGDAGYGKSAFVAKLIDRLKEPAGSDSPAPGVLYFFLRKTSTEHTPDVFLFHVIAQLQEYIGLRNIRVPVDPTTRRALYRSLWRLAATATTEETPLYLIIDGLDEFESSRGSELVQLLPDEPFPNTYVLLTTRENPDLNRLVPDPTHPVRSVVPYLLPTLSEPDVCGLLKSFPTDLPAQEIEAAGPLLHERLGGHPLITRFVCEDVAGGRYPADRVHPGMSRNVQAYFESQLHNIEQEAQDVRDVALMLALAKGPMTTSELEDLVHVNQLGLDARQAVHALDRYLIGTEAKALCHLELAALVLNTSASKLTAFRSYFSSWIKHYAVQDWPSETPSYVLNQAITHTFEVGKVDPEALHPFLTRAWALRRWSGANRSFESLLADLDLLIASALEAEPIEPARALKAVLIEKFARRSSDAISDTILKALALTGQPQRAISIARQRSSLVSQLRGQVTVLEHAYDPKLFSDLVTGLGQVEQASDASDLAVRLVHTAPPEHVPVIQQALIPRIKNGSLKHILGRLCGLDVHLALSVAQRIGDASDRVRGLAEIASKTTDPQQAVEIAQSINDASRRAWVLAEIASRTTDPQQAANIVDLALSSAQSINDAYSRAQALAEIASKTTDPQRAAEIAQSINDASRRAWVLAEIAGRTTDPQRAAEIAQSINDAYLRAETLVEIASKTTDPQQAANIVDLALSSAQSINDAYSRAQALAEIASRTTDPQQAAEIARSIDDDSRAQVLAEIAGRTTDPQQAAEIAQSIEDAYLRAETLVEIASETTDPQQAAGIAQSIKDASPRADAVTKIANRLLEQKHDDDLSVSHSGLVGLLEVARSIPSDSDRKSLTVQRLSRACLAYNCVSAALDLIRTSKLSSYETVSAIAGSSGAHSPVNADVLSFAYEIMNWPALHEDA
ncbi:MAG: NACHT domain-containing protein [Bacteroidota bacterium]